MFRKVICAVLLLVTASMSGFAQEKGFSLILYPDPQNYNKYAANQPIFELMTAWTAENVDDLGVKAVLCTGDLVEQNELLTPDGKNGDRTSAQQWEAASNAFKRLDNVVPYILCGGNHDYGYVRAENRMTNLPKYFPVERNSLWQDCLVSVCNNFYGVPTLENAAYEFHDANWGDLLVIAAEFAPRDEVLEWAGKLCSKYKDHKVIFLTHSYMRAQGEIVQSESYGVSPANYGQAIWDKLVFPSSNIRLVLCGHYSDARGGKYNVAFRSDKNQAGDEVFQMLFNAQTDGGGWQGNGGDGWLRILEFLPDGKTVSVKTFSPLFAFSPSTSELAWRMDLCDRFVFVIN